MIEDIIMTTIVLGTNSLLDIIGNTVPNYNLLDTDYLGFQIDLPFSVNPNAWVTGVAIFRYSELKTITSSDFVSLLNSRLSDYFVTQLGYPQEEMVIFSTDDTHSLKVESRPLGFVIKTPNPASKLIDGTIPNLLSIPTLLGIDAPQDQEGYSCSTGTSIILKIKAQANGQSLGFGVYVEFKTGNSWSSLTPRAVNAMEAASLFFFFERALNDLNYYTLEKIDQGVENGYDYRQYRLTSIRPGCTIFKFRNYGNVNFTIEQDPNATIGVEIHEAIIGEGPWGIDMAGAAYLGVSNPVTPEFKKRFRVKNTSGNFHRIELRPIGNTPGVLTAVDSDQPPDGITLFTSPEPAYGFCLAPDLCYGDNIGDILAIGLNGKIGIGIITLFDVTNQIELGTINTLDKEPPVIANELMTLFNQNGFNSTLIGFEPYYVLNIVSSVNIDRVIELRLPSNVDNVPIEPEYNGFVEINVTNANYSIEERTTVDGNFDIIRWCAKKLEPVPECIPSNSVWSKDIYFNDVNLPNADYGITVMVGDNESTNVSINLALYNNILNFMSQVETKLNAALGFNLISYRQSPNDPEAVQIHYIGQIIERDTPNALTSTAQTYTKWATALQDNRNNPAMVGTAAETLLNLANFFDDVDQPTVYNCLGSWDNQAS